VFLTVLSDELRVWMKKVPGNQLAVPATTNSFHCPDHPIVKTYDRIHTGQNASGIPPTQKEFLTEMDYPLIMRIQYE
jgi:hypothetical protein